MMSTGEKAAMPMLGDRPQSRGAPEPDSVAAVPMRGSARDDQPKRHAEIEVCP